MRVIAGSARGRKLFSPPGGKKCQSIRPTADRVKEAIFSILGPKTAGATVLDLYAGTGALGIEALSRGAAAGLFIDSNRPALETIARNLELCNFTDQAHIMQKDLRQGLAFLNHQQLLPAPSTLVLVDPPYRRDLALFTLEALGTLNCLAKDCIIVVEEDKKTPLPSATSFFTRYDTRTYGDTGIFFYRMDNR